LSRTRDISNIFDDNSPIVNDNELIIAINTASAAAVNYTDNELGSIDLTSAIVTASTAAVSYADALTTTDIAEGTQFYFTNSRAINAGSATYIPQTSQQSIINSASGAAVTYLVNSAPSTLDTLNELATALGNDANFSTTVTNLLDTKLNASTASATYLTQSNASSTYLTQAEGLTAVTASSTYLTQVSASTQYEKLIPYSTSTPTSPVTGDMWLDSNSTPPALKVYDGSNWVQLGAAVDDSQAIIAGRMFA
jgi:hypothetical protein